MSRAPEADAVELRPHDEATVEPPLRWRNDAEIHRMSSDGPAPTYTREQVVACVQRWMTPDPQIVHFAICLRGRGAPIGFLHLAMIEPERKRCRLGLVIGEKDMWGRAYGRAAVLGADEYAFTTLQLERITGEVFADSPRSARLLHGAGFVREGVMRASIRRDGAPVDELIFGLLATDPRPALIPAP